jgi:hypothetical protein
LPSVTVPSMSMTTTFGVHPSGSHAMNRGWLKDEDEHSP